MDVPEMLLDNRMVNPREDRYTRGEEWSHIDDRRLKVRRRWLSTKESSVWATLDSRQWHVCLSEKLRRMDLSLTHEEPCLYRAHCGKDVFLLLIYVDNILVASQNEGWVTEVKQDLMRDFEIKDLGTAKHCLGLEITQEKDAIFLSQKGYTLCQI